MKSLHIIAFDIPYPPNYGGVIDIFFKLKHLNKNGVSITLHCFEYGRKKAKELESFCDTIYYYKRNVFKNPLIGTLPYIVESRNSQELLNNLLRDNEPIIFEGLHTTYLLDHPKLKKRYKILRTHNIEHEYYKHLELVESNYFKKYFYRLESERLRKYEKKIQFADLLCPLSLKDEKYFNKKHSKVRFVPPFHSNENVDIHPLKGNFILYHGNLAVGENNRAALYLCNEVFSKVKFPVVIAGTKPSKELRRKIDKFSHIKLMANIDLNYNYFQTEEITNLIHKHLHDNRNRVIEANVFRERYENNRDIFIHMRLDDVAERNPGIEYYKSCLESIVREKDYQDIYITSDSPDHEMIAQLRAAYPYIQLIYWNEVDTIHFGSTCKYVILSHGTFSGMIGYLAFFTDEIYYPDENKTNGWCPMSVFTGKGWIPK